MDISLEVRWQCFSFANLFSIVWQATEWSNPASLLGLYHACQLLTLLQELIKTNSALRQEVGQVMLPRSLKLLRKRLLSEQCK